MNPEKKSNKKEIPSCDYQIRRQSSHKKRKRVRDKKEKVESFKNEKKKNIPEKFFE